MQLSLTQRAMLIRMLGHWTWPTDGRKAHGWGQTLYSLEKKDLVEWRKETEDYSAGWTLTEQGQTLARTLRDNDPEAFKKCRSDY